jgi:hypothetical protein
MSFQVPRTLLIVGTLCVLVGTIDPLEGSILILIGVALLAVGARLGRTRSQALLAWALLLVAIGVGAMFALSAVGGVGGSTGRSMAWLILVAPYPVGWAMGLVGAYRGFRESNRGPAPA